MVYSCFLGNIFYRHSIDRTLIDQSNQVVNLVLNDERLQNIIFPDYDSNSTRPVRPPRPTRPTRPPITTKPPEMDDSKYYTFRKCKSKPSLTCGLEVTLLILTMFLTSQEILQLVTLGPKSYFSEFENFLEITTLTLVYLGLFFQNDLYVLKWLSAWGICLAYVELIFLLGKYSRQNLYTPMFSFFGKESSILHF